jgi:hypothetical protein
MEVSFNREKDYLLLMLEGIYDHTEFNSALKLAQSKCMKYNYKKLFIDLRNADLSSTKDMERFFTGEKIADLFTKQPRVKIAVTAKEEEITYFARTVARNRGANIELFSDLKKAFEWL